MKNDAIRDYFNDFVSAFATYSGERVAGKFAVPFMVRGELGESKIFHSLAGIAEYFQAHLNEYKAKGCSKCRYSNLEIKWLGSESALASVDWELLDQSDTPQVSWSESYLLSVSGKQVLAYATVDHVSERRDTDTNR